MRTIQAPPAAREQPADPLGDGAASAIHDGGWEGVGIVVARAQSMKSIGRAGLSSARTRHIILQCAVRTSPGVITP